jgi:hypothetical protein
VVGGVNVEGEVGAVCVWNSRPSLLLPSRVVDITTCMYIFHFQTILGRHRLSLCYHAMWIDNADQLLFAFK